MMNVLIIEDEVLAADRLEAMLKVVAPDIQVLARLSSIKDSVRWLMQHSADLIFLDIQLSDGLSFTIFEQVTVTTPIIFTTAYDQYAIRAFKLNSVDYLLKPIRQSELHESIRKYRTLKSAYSIDFEELLNTLHGNKPDYKKRFMIQYGERIRKVEISEVAYFYAMDKSVFLKTFEGQSYPLDYTLDRLEEFVDPARFFRINRKYIVCIDAISSMTAWSRNRVKVELKPAAEDTGDTIVSIDRAADFKAWLNS
jgi:DNA-binding LytR/AlgR family response regulator